MTANEKHEIAYRFKQEGNEAVYEAIINTLTNDELLELLTEDEKGA